MILTEKPNSELREIAEVEKGDLIGSIDNHCEEIVEVIIPKLDAFQLLNFDTNNLGTNNFLSTKKEGFWPSFFAEYIA
jgi:hypothetical protein